MSKTKLVYLFLILIILLTLIYSNHFNNAFHFDDMHTIVNNVHIRDLSNWTKFFTDATTFSSLPTNQSYRPITVLTLSIDYWLGNGYNLFYFHLSTYICFILQLVLMYFLLLKIFSFASQKQNAVRVVAFVAIIFYAFHAANAETINYIIARADLYSALFTVMAIVLYAYFPNKRKYYFYLIPLAIGILSKPPTIMFLPILFIYIYLFEENLPHDFSKSGIFNDRIKPIFFKILPTIIFILFFAFLISKMETGTFYTGVKDAWLYRLTQPFVIILYIKTFFFPIHLSADSDIFSAVNYFDTRIYLGIILLLILVIFTIALAKNKSIKPITFGIFWFLLGLFPTSWIALSEALNDHRTFFPYIGLLISTSWSIYLLYEMLANKYSIKLINRYFIIFLGITIGLNAFGTYERNKVWKTESSLWYDVTIKSPKNGRGLMNYGLTLMEVGKYTEAEEYFLKALKFTPNYSNLHTNLGIVTNALGKKNEAENYFRNSIKYSVGSQSSYMFYGNWLLNEGRLQEAKINFEKGLSISKNDILIRHKLMNVYDKLKEKENLKNTAKSTLVILPNDSISLGYLNGFIKAESKGFITNPVSALINESLAFYNDKDYVNCIASCEKVLKLDPKNAIAYNNMCSAYNAMGDFKKGKKAGLIAVKLDPNNQLAKNNLNWSIKNIK